MSPLSILVFLFRVFHKRSPNVVDFLKRITNPIGIDKFDMNGLFNVDCKGLERVYKEELEYFIPSRIIPI